MNGIDTPNVVKTLDVNTRVNIYSTTSIHYGNIEYYIIELENNKFGYINKNDLTYLSQVINYEPILPDATLRSFNDSGEITVYSMPDKNSEIISTVKAGTRVLIIDQETYEDFIQVKFYDSNDNLIEGYVNKNQVNSDDITDNQKTALILVASSIALLVFISITITIIYKKRNKKRAI